MSAFSGNPPLSYTTPKFPSLYWPIRASPGEPQYLYYFSDIWRYILNWTLITVSAAHLIVAVWAVLMQFTSAYSRRAYLKSPAGQSLSAKNRKLLGETPISETVGWVWLVPTIYIVLGAAEALMAGSIVGVVLGAVYNAGYFKMSTWTPLLWGVINMLVLVVASFRIQGGL
jgi:Putative transmembrane protein 170